MNEHTLLDNVIFCTKSCIHKASTMGLEYKYATLHTYDRLKSCGSHVRVP